MPEPAADRRAQTGANPDAGSGCAPAILLAEATPELGAALCTLLRAEGYEAALARSRGHVAAMLAWRRWRLAIIGEMGGPRAALELLALISQTDTPVLVIGDACDQLALVRAFEAGAEDFMARPPSHLELRLRVRALLCRGEAAGAARPTIITVGALRIDPLRRRVTLHGRPLELRRMEYELLLRLAGEPSRVQSRAELLGEVWGCACACSTRTLDSHASRLRRKLAAIDGGRWVVNVRGVGYRLI